MSLNLCLFLPPLDQLNLTLFLPLFNVRYKPSSSDIQMARHTFNASPTLHNYITHLLHLRHLYPDFVLHNSAHLFFLDNYLKHHYPTLTTAYVSLYQADKQHKVIAQTTFARSPHCPLSFSVSTYA